MENVSQSCVMFMSPNDYGKNADGSVNIEYCKYCFSNGKFGKDENWGLTSWEDTYRV